MVAVVVNVVAVVVMVVKVNRVLMAVVFRTLNIQLKSWIIRII